MRLQGRLYSVALTISNGAMFFNQHVPRCSFSFSTLPAITSFPNQHFSLRNQKKIPVAVYESFPSICVQRLQCSVYTSVLLFISVQEILSILLENRVSTAWCGLASLSFHAQYRHQYRFCVDIGLQWCFLFNTLSIVSTCSINVHDACPQQHDPCSVLKLIMCHIWWTSLEHKLAVKIDETHHRCNSWIIAARECSVVMRSVASLCLCVSLCVSVLFGL